MIRKTVQLKGILVAVTTPFTADAAAIDEPVLAAQVERLITAGVHGLVPCGTTGEFTTLSPQEYRRVIELYVESAAGRVPVVAGSGGALGSSVSPFDRYLARTQATLPL